MPVPSVLRLLLERHFFHQYLTSERRKQIKAAVVLLPQTTVIIWVKIQVGSLIHRPILVNQKSQEIFGNQSRFNLGLLYFRVCKKRTYNFYRSDFSIYPPGFKILCSQHDVYTPTFKLLKQVLVKLGERHDMIKKIHLLTGKPKLPNSGSLKTAQIQTLTDELKRV